MIVHSDELLTLYLGDCVAVMAGMEPESVAAIVTDPPYGLEFMGKGWDRLGAGIEDVQEGTDDSHPFRNGTRRVRFGATAKTMQAWHEAWAREAFRVAKPGAHLLAFGGTRTYHRLASAIEDAGWEIRDCLVWGYASGFPKSLDVSKAIDRAAGVDTTADERWRAEPHFITGKFKTASGKSQQIGQALPGERHVYEPTAAGRDWQGWGTALKPAWEPIVMARKPLRGTVAANVLAHGTGALNIDATRIDWRDPLDAAAAAAVGYSKSMAAGRTSEPTSLPTTYDKPPYEPETMSGRWPANLLLSDPIFDGGVEGVVGGGATNVAWTRPSNGIRDASAYDFGPAEGESGPFYGDSGTYSRFFLIPKSSRSDREPLVWGTLPERDAGSYDGNADHSEGATRKIGARPDRPVAARANSHPTVKPLDLMRHLVRLVTPPGGTVLDCFLGSGTTAIAANAEGFRCIGIEREREYLDIAVARLAHQPLGMQL